jgi:alkylation response protein AidB-like acyl-CoA dehydrogenase
MNRQVPATDMSMLLEDCGYAALPGPFLFSSVLAASALAGGGSEDVNDRWLGPLAEGRAIGTVAIVEANDSINPADLSTTARKSGSGWILNGAKMFVPYAHKADFVIVLARTGPGAHDIGLFLVEPNSSGVHIRRLNNLDMTRRFCAVELDAVVVPAQAALSGRQGL